MPDIAERYDRLAAGFLARITATPPDRWGATSPCAGWTARDVVAHVVNGHRGILAGVLGTAPRAAHGVGVARMSGAPDVAPGADLAAAFAECRADLLAVLADPHLAGKPMPSPLGVVPVERAVDAIGALELLVHTWDLARAVGGDERLDPDAVVHTYQLLEPHYAALQATGAFQPRVMPPDGADPQTRFLCFAGRRP